jgi:ABC-type multidrug transport system fused ATPase/permease subunit
MSASFFTSYQVDEETEAEFKFQLNNMTKTDKEQHFSNVFHRFDELDEEEVNSVLGTEKSNDLLVNLFGCKFEDNMLDLVSLIGILFIGALGGAAVILWQNASYFASGEYSEKSVFIGKIVSAACAAVALGVSIVYVITANDFIAAYLPEGYKLSIAAGVICLAAFAIGSIFCPHKMAPRVTKNGTEAPAKAAAE